MGINCCARVLLNQGADRFAADDNRMPVEGRSVCFLVALLMRYAIAASHAEKSLLSFHLRRADRIALPVSVGKLFVCAFSFSARAVVLYKFHASILLSSAAHQMIINDF